MKQFDERIGLYEHYDPLLCGHSGQSIDGRHSTTMRIVGNYCFRVLNKFRLEQPEMEKIQKKLLKLIPPKEVTRLEKEQRDLLTKIEAKSAKEVTNDK